ncbi:DUF1493 family protein [Chryseobacterium indologenes]|uniref:DUF1493 family protein n=1 Tax=Chryseobacterium indologenes TaxID=253 RepID=A0AAD0YXK2_CHRID|nr:DUF1493 family protein [Chryseobacterium indologenes]AZB18816.1 DUF1493 family protein [Chryseobacterium indologenes]
MMKDLEKKIIDFFSKYDIPIKDVNAIINPDFILSDDANIIMGRFIKEFNIEKGYLEIDKFFEPLSSISFNLFKKKGKKVNRPLITVAHMIEVARRKEWFDPE